LVHRALAGLLVSQGPRDLLEIQDLKDHLVLQAIKEQLGRPEH